MKTLNNAIAKVTLTQNKIANTLFASVLLFIAVTLIAVSIEIGTNPEAIQFGF